MMVFNIFIGIVLIFQALSVALMADYELNKCTITTYVLVTFYWCLIIGYYFIYQGI